MEIIRTDSNGTATVIGKVGVVDSTLSTTSNNPVTNATVTTNINQINENLSDLKMLGWSVPADCPIQNSVSGNTFTQNVGRVDLGSLTWDYDTSMAQFKTTISDIKNVTKNLYCIKYTVTNSTSWTGIANNEMGNLSGTNFRIKDTSYTDATTFKSAMNGVYLYYELATPITMAIDGNEVVSEIKNDLTANSYGESAGGKNLVSEFNNGKGIATQYNACLNAFVDLKPSTTYAISFNGASGHIIYFNENVFVTSQYFSLTSDRFSIVLTTKSSMSKNDDGSYTISKNFTGNTVVPDFSNVQIEESSTATDYEPYIESNYQLTEDVAEINSSLTEFVTKTYTNQGSGTFTYIKIGKTIHFNAAITKTTSSWTVFSLPGMTLKNVPTGSTICIGYCSDISMPLLASQESSYIAIQLRTTNTTDSTYYVSGSFLIA